MNGHVNGLNAADNEWSVEPARDRSEIREKTADGVVPPVLWLLVTAIWLPFLFYPMRDLLQMHLSPMRLIIALAGAVIFVAIYLWLMLHDPFRDAVLSAQEYRMHLALLGTLGAVVLFLTFAYSIDWLWFLMYATIAAGVKLPLRSAAWVIIGLTVLAFGVGGATVGWLVAGRIVSPIGAVGFSMIGVARLVVTIRALRAARAEIARLAVAEERLRFARDLHDLLGHSLSTIAIKTALAHRLLPDAPERAMRELDDVQMVTQDALKEVRDVVTGYRQPTLMTELANARELLAAAGITCDCQDTSGTLSPAIESVLAWAVREGVTNIVRHSRARHATISIRQGHGTVSADISDDGERSPEASPTPRMRGGSGLRGLTERAAAIGGQIEARPGATGGFRLSVTLPLRSHIGRAMPAVGAGRPQ